MKGQKEEVKFGLVFTCQQWAPQRHYCPISYWENQTIQEISPIPIVLLHHYHRGLLTSNWPILIWISNKKGTYDKVVAKIVSNIGPCLVLIYNVHKSDIPNTGMKKIKYYSKYQNFVNISSSESSSLIYSGYFGFGHKIINKTFSPFWNNCNNGK